MNFYVRNLPTRENNPPAQRRSEPPKKRPVQLGKPLHELISMMANDDSLSLEQVISGAVISKARLRLDTSDVERQTRYFLAIKEAENEIKRRYHGEKTRRSIQMRRINNTRRQESSTAPHAANLPTAPHVGSHASPPSSNSIYSYGYPIEYRYGIPVPVPPRQF